MWSNATCCSSELLRNVAAPCFLMSCSVSCPSMTLLGKPLVKNEVLRIHNPSQNIPTNKVFEPEFVTQSLCCLSQDAGLSWNHSWDASTLCLVFCIFQRAMILTWFLVVFVLKFVLFLTESTDTICWNMPVYCDPSTSLTRVRKGIGRCLPTGSPPLPRRHVYTPRTPLGHGSCSCHRSGSACTVGNSA